MSIKDKAKKIVDKIMGTSAGMSDQGIQAAPNRKERRRQLAMRLSSASAAARLKFEKRVAPGRMSKGRAPTGKGRRTGR